MFLPRTLALSMTEIGLGVVGVAVFAFLWMWWRTRRLQDDFEHALRELGFTTAVPVPPVPRPFASARTGMLNSTTPITLVIGSSNDPDEDPKELRESTNGIGVILPSQPRFSEAWMGRWEKLSLAHNTAFTIGAAEAPDDVRRLQNGSVFLYFDVPHSRKAVALLLGSLRSNLP